MPRLPPVSPGCRRRRLALLSGLVFLQALLAASQAQMTLDGSLGPPGPLSGPHYRIGAELGQIRGGNLFHSFGQFHVPTGGSATFTGPATITNILGRVTGGQASSIDGLLKSEIAGANLYLLNPSGVLFGPNASLEVSGSFHVSTADYLRFADGATFAAHLGRESVLTVAPPQAFGFLGPPVGALTLQGGTLEVPEGRTLSFVGGEVQLQGGGLVARGGRIQLLSVASPGEAVFNPLEAAPDLQLDSFAQFERIALSAGVVVRVDGSATRDAGAIMVRGGPVTLTGGSRLSADTIGPGQGGRIAVHADQVTIAEGAVISAATGEQGTGRAGTVTVTATEAVLITGEGSGLSAGTNGPGEAGRIAVDAPTVHLTERGLIEARTFGSGRGGTIDIWVDTLTLTSGGRIAANTTDGSGHAGAITITAGEAVVIAGRFSETVGHNSSVESTAERSSGDSGRIVIQAPSVRLTDEGAIDARVSSGSIGRGGTITLAVGRLTLDTGGQINISSTPAGGGGHFTVHATDTVTIGGRSVRGLGRARGAQRSGLLTQNESPAQGGDIEVVARHIDLYDGGIISTNSNTIGAAGNITILAGETFLSRRGVVRAQTRGSAGGTIALRAGRLVQLVDSELSTSVRGGGSDAGNLTLEAPVLVVGNSTISANAFEGTGGNIGIKAEVFLADPASLVDASSELGISGTVDIQAPVTTLSGTLAPLPQTFVNVAVLLPARCAARLSGGQASSLVLGGRDRLPLEPGGLLPSPLTLDERLTADPAVIGASPRQPSTARFALLTGRDNALPRLGCPH